MSEPAIIPDKMPAMFEHASEIYDAMLQKAEKKGDKVVYKGYFTRLIIGDLKKSTPVYSQATTLLKQMGCIRQLRRGGGGSPSEWALIKSPQPVDFFNTSDQKEITEAKHGKTPGQIRMAELESLFSETLQEVEHLKEQERKLIDALVEQGKNVNKMREQNDTIMEDNKKMRENLNSMAKIVEKFENRLYTLERRGELKL